jgi:hypothetical protein
MSQSKPDRDGHDEIEHAHHHKSRAQIEEAHAWHPHISDDVHFGLIGDMAQVN